MSEKQFYHDKNTTSVEIIRENNENMSNKTGNKRKRASKEQMFKALFELIQTKRLQDISVSELCKMAQVNRTTFYNHYDNVGALAQDARQSILNEYVHQFDGNTDGYTPENLLIMFRHFYNNQIIYRTYFRLKPSYKELLDFYDRDLARRYYPGQSENLMRYHAEFFAAGITAIIKKWLADGCKETPEEMTKIVVSEYSGKAK